MKRRSFLKLAGFSVMMGAGFPLPLRGKEPAVVAVAEGTDYNGITRSAVAALGGMKKFVKSGDTVVVKPNIGWDRKPEFAATTHPAVVKAIVEECLAAGARRVKVFDIPCNDPRRCYENSGIQGALKGMKNVEMKHPEPDRFKATGVKGVFMKDWELYDEALSANVFINVPIAKHHSLTSLTIALKNIMGIMGGNRGYIHRDMENALADLNKTVKSHLVVVDATRILLDHGPQGGNLKDVKVLNKIIASTDIVAADAVATTLFGMKPEQLATTVAAYKRGLGEMDLKKIKVVRA